MGAFLVFSGILVGSMNLINFVLANGERESVFVDIISS